VVLKVGGMATWEAILRSTWAKKLNGVVVGVKQHKETKMLNHLSIFELSSVA